MTAPAIVLGTEVPELTVILQYGADTSFAIDVTDNLGAPADLTGRIATIETVDGDTWTATVVSSMFTWTITAEQSRALKYHDSSAVLAVSDVAGTRAIWGRGRVMVRR